MDYAHRTGGSSEKRGELITQWNIYLPPAGEKQENELAGRQSFGHFH